MKGPTKGQFEVLFQDGKRQSGRFCRVSAGPGSGKLGIATSKKIGCHARRNRNKRRFRAAAQSLKELLDPRLDYILIVSPIADGVELGEIREEIRKLIGRVNARWAEEWESS